MKWLSSHNQQSCSLSLYKVPLYCVVSCPHVGNVLTIPLTSTLSLATVAAVDHKVCTSLTVSLPGACLWPLCINVKLSISCILLSLFYYCFINIIFCCIWLLFSLLSVFFCHLLVSFLL